MPPRLPDFLLIGAMRAGTTSLHHVLASHPRVAMPEREIFFFDSDDFEEHAEEHIGPGGAWRLRDYERELPEALPAYLRHFEAAGDRLAGEDSTTYLTAERAPERAARLLPDAKILVILRDPVERAWSHYWHLVQSGRAVLDFEASLVSARGTLLKRSTYAPALARWQRVYPREQICVLLFEELWADPQPHIDRIAAFLGLPETVQLSTLPPERVHRHRAVAPRWPALQRAASFLAREGAPIARRPGGLPGLLAAASRLGSSPGKPEMRPDTRRFLEGQLGRANAGLPDLLGRSLDGLWPWLRATA